MFERKQCEVPDLRLCEKCRRVVPLKEMYTWERWDIYGQVDIIAGAICFHCANEPVEKAKNDLLSRTSAMREAENAKYTPKQVEVTNLPKGKIAKTN